MSAGPRVRAVMSAWDTFQVPGAASHSLSSPRVPCLAPLHPFSRQAVWSVRVHTSTQRSCWGRR